MPPLPRPRSELRPGPARTTFHVIALAAVGAVLWSCNSAGPSATAAIVATPSATAIVATATPLATPSPTSRARVTLASTPLQMITAPGLPDIGQVATTPMTVTIVAAGDIACDPKTNTGTPADCDQAATAAEVGQIDPTAVITLGDNQYEDNRLSAYEQVYAPTWGVYLSKTFPTIGNHEYLTPNAAGYFAYFHFPPYYSFNLGNWHIVSLDSECHYVGGCEPGSPQERWLRADLAAHPALCTLVTWHEPRFSSGEHGDASQMTTIWADLVAANVDVVLTGHNHDYERFTALDATGRPDPSGTVEFVVGTGGKNHYGFVQPPLPGELIRNDTSFGVIRMRLEPTGYSWRFMPAPGYSFTDSGSAKCH